jgi:AraC family transcriptional regulator
MANYQKRLYQLLDYLDGNLDQILTTETLSRISCLSRFHFHRQFVALFGLNIATYIRILKFKRAAYLLAYRKTLVLEIGLGLGYESSEAFSRAFKQLCQQSPSDFRLNPNWKFLKEQEDYLIQVRRLPVHSTKLNSVKYPVEVVELPELPLAILEHKGDPHLLGETIRQFIRWRKENNLPPNKYRTFNLLYNDPDITSCEEYRFGLAVEYHDSLPFTSGLVEGKIPAGTYALIRYQGSDSGLGDAVNYLYRDWLANTDFELRDFPPFIERILFYPDVPETQQMMHIYLPLQQGIL